MADQGIQFTVQVQGLSELTAAFAHAPAIVTPILQRALSASNAILASHTVKGTVPFRTGFLTQTFRAEMQGLVLRWFPTASYAAAVEFGHKQEVGRFVPAIGKRLVQPFVKGDPYMERIVEQSQGEINDTFTSALSQIAAAIAANSS